MCLMMLCPPVASRDGIMSVRMLLYRLAVGSFLVTARLMAEPSPESLLYSILSDYGFTSAQVEQVYANIDVSSSGRVYSSSGFDLLIDRGRIIIEPRRSDKTYENNRPWGICPF